MPHRSVGKYMAERIATVNESGELSVGNALRHKLFNIITPVLLGCDRVDDAATRLMIRSCCTDMVSSIEQLIREYQLDGVKRS